MNKLKGLTIVGSVVLLGLTGCSTYPTASYGDHYSGYTSNADYNRVYGTITRIRTVDIQGPDYRGPGLGAVAGVVVGGILGNQIGHGTGRALATGAGAIAGGLAGDKIEQNTSGNRWAQEIEIRLDNGDYTRILQPGDSRLSVGTRVYITGSGQQARVHIR